MAGPRASYDGSEDFRRMNSTVGAPQYGGDFLAEPGPALPFVLPGETVEQTNAGLHILQPSPERVAPGCIHFGICGGCQYQHASYPAQLAIKREILKSILPAKAPTAVAHAAQPWGYRNRIRLRLRFSAESLEVGYSHRGANDFLPVRMCPIAAPLLWRAAQTLCSLGALNPAAARWLRSATELELFCTPSEDKLQMQLFLREADAGQHTASTFAALCTQLHGLLPELSGAGASMHPDAPRRARLGWSGVAWQVPGLLYPVAGREYWVSRGAFFQVNRFLVDTLIALVACSHTGRLAWDLYAGVGLFARALASSFRQVVAVEGNPTAAAELVRLTRAQPGISAHQQPTLDFLRAAVSQRDRPDLVVLDPPRAGLGVEAAALLGRIGAAEIVYVSCDPTTLARDLTVLLGAGYRIASVDLVDLFPQTFHLETIVALRRISPPLV